MITLPHLETNITLRCQLSCRSCNHFVPLQRNKRTDIEPEAMQKDLERLGKIAHAEAYALIGGEPLLHKQFMDILQVAKFSGIADIVEVWTNGLLLRKQPDAFWKAMNRHKIVLSAYPGKINDSDIAWIKSKCLENGVQLGIKDARHLNYYTALLTRPKTDEQAHYAYKNCWYRTFTFVVDGGYFYRCCTTPFIPSLLLGMPKETDGLSLSRITEKKLQDFLDQPETPRSCKVCGMAVNPNHQWSEEKDPQKWLEVSHA